MLVGLAGLLLTAGSLPALADDLDKRKDDVERKIQQADRHADESSEELQAATEALLRAQAELASAQSYLAQTREELAAAEARDLLMQRRLDAAEQRLARARADLQAGRQDVSAQLEQLRQVVVATYEEGDPSLMGLSMVFTTQDPAALAGQLNARTSVTDVEATILDQLEASQVLLTVRRTEIREARDEVAKRRAEAAENLARKQALEQQAEAAEAQVRDLVAARAQARAAALTAKKKDLAELARLQAERDRIEQLILQRASVGQGFSGPVGNGFLDAPVPGPITSAYGWRIHPIFGYRSLHDGVDFGVSCGTPIRAAAPGRVLAEYYQSAWGNRIVIDHGVKYGAGVATISNHLSGYAVSVGERVTRGQVVGYVGNTGWSTGCHLHFTVLDNGSAVDPMIWF